jgi:hypothetical protein
MQSEWNIETLVELLMKFPSESNIFPRSRFPLIEEILISKKKPPNQGPPFRVALDSTNSYKFDLALNHLVV